MLNFDFLEIGLGVVTSPHFVYDFTRKNISHAIFYKLTKFDYLIAFSSWDIGQYVFGNYLFPVCDVINSEINFSFLIKPFF